MASTALILAFKGDQVTLEASGLSDEIRRKYRDLSSKKSSKGTEFLELWEKSSGLSKRFDFGKLERNQVNLDGGINPFRDDKSKEETSEETDEEMTSDELKEALTKLEIEFDGRLGHDKLQALYDEATATDEK